MSLFDGKVQFTMIGRKPSNSQTLKTNRQRKPKLTLFEDHPGPWTYEPDLRIEGFFHIRDAYDDLVAEVYGRDLAKLFASLPHLFAIVKGFWDDQKENGDPDDEFLASVRNLMESLES